jgi:hypothetical protein
MKFYETTFEEYIQSVKRYNLHPDIPDQCEDSILQFENKIVYGPPGIGKYSQVLYMLRKYSPTELKYEKKITIQMEKQEYIYHISDIHYEIDMSLLGCNSKNIWHDIYGQIVDIISIKPDKIGIIVCKNFHMIHAELLEIFYSYIQQFNNRYMAIKVKFVLITEHLSFIPQKILNACNIIRMGRPCEESYRKLLDYYTLTKSPTLQVCAFTPKSPIAESNVGLHNDFSYFETSQKNNSTFTGLALDGEDAVKTPSMNSSLLLESVKTDNILNIKELRSFPLIDSTNEVPEDIFNIVCDGIIKEMENPKKIKFTQFRDVIYDILIYNLDACECIWYIICHFIQPGKSQMTESDISAILQKTHLFLKYYNNNYRPIYHLESMLFYIINKLHRYGSHEKRSV